MLFIRPIVIISDDSLPNTPSETAIMIAGNQQHAGKAVSVAPISAKRATRFAGGPHRDRRGGGSRDQALARIGRVIALKARGKASIGEYYKGSTWMALSSRSVDVILTSWDKDILLKESFEFSLFPDEAYFHTILGNHRLLSSRRLMHDDWSVQSPPRVFRTFEELLAIVPDDALFVRKVVLEAADMERWMRQSDLTRLY